MPNQPAFTALLDHYLELPPEQDPPDQPQPQAVAGRTIRGQYPPPQEELDLHGLTAEEAEKAVFRFIGQCRELGLTTLRIITGKGLHSPGPPVLPGITEAALLTLQNERHVRDFHWEKKRRGHGGAVIVYLI